MKLCQVCKDATALALLGPSCEYECVEAKLILTQMYGLLCKTCNNGHALASEHFIEETRPGT